MTLTGSQSAVFAQGICVMQAATESVHLNSVDERFDTIMSMLVIAGRPQQGCQLPQIFYPCKRTHLPGRP